MLWKIDNDKVLENAKSKAKKYNLAIGHGLNLVVMPADKGGGKYWVLRYRYGGKQREITVGRPYPETSLKTAKKEALALRAQIAKGTDPGEERRRERLAIKARVSNTFGQAAEAWLDFRAPALNEKTTKQIRHYLDNDLFPKLGGRPLDNITPMEIGALIAGIEERGAFDVARKCRQWFKAIYSYARARGWTSKDPGKDLHAVAKPAPRKKKFAHVGPDELAGLVQAMDGYDGWIVTKVCAWLCLWAANRPGVTRTLRWDELDLDAGIWTITADRELMKRGYKHYTPLPTQAVAALRSLHDITGRYEHVFVGRHDPGKALSDGAVNGMLKRCGFKGKQTGHGFRHLVSTCLNERGYEADWIERQLAHGDPDSIRGTYNEAHYLEPRRKMMQEWADYLDTLRE